jgi:hypothetical protein
MAAAASECVRGKCCCCWVRERKLVELWREVEIRNRKKQGKHKTNGEINEQITIKKLNEHVKLGFLIFSISFHYSTCLFFHIFHIFSLFNLLFFHIFHIFSQLSSVFSNLFHYSTYFSSIFSIARKVSWIVKRYEKYGRNPSWIVIRFGKYKRKLWNNMKNMEETQVE